MSKLCDHTSVGMFVWNEDKLLLIERAKFPFGYAIPAGHVDGDKTYEDAARRELKEEVGFDTKKMEIIFEGRKENPCRREGGAWHYWKLYKVVTDGFLSRSMDETKKVGWYSKDQIRELAKRTELYKEGRISQEEWERDPGLEILMLDWVNELKIA